MITSYVISLITPYITHHMLCHVLALRVVFIIEKNYQKNYFII
jgi:hypothetical protein